MASPPSLICISMRALSGSRRRRVAAEADEISPKRANHASDGGPLEPMAASTSYAPRRVPCVRVATGIGWDYMAWRQTGQAWGDAKKRPSRVHVTVLLAMPYAVALSILSGVVLVAAIRGPAPQRDLPYQAMGNAIDLQLFGSGARR